MPLELSQVEFTGPAFPEPFVQFELEPQLLRIGTLPKTSGEAGKGLEREWEAYRRRLRQLGSGSGSVRVRNQVLEPLSGLLGYAGTAKSNRVVTREEEKGEDGGFLFTTQDGEQCLRIWATDYEADLDAPARRGSAYRFSHLKSAQRVLLASGERVGLLTNGVQLRLLVSDPARQDSQIIIPLDLSWIRSRKAPDSFRLLLALASPKGVAAVPGLIDKARLMQARVTKDLRVQARQAVERFIQEVLDHPANREALAGADRAALARDLWHEGLILVYRLLFILKMETSDDPARAFSFASTSLWRNTFSPSTALARYAREILDNGAETGSLLESGLRSLFRMFVAGLQCSELHVKPLGGALFGEHTTPWFSRLAWGERAVAHLLDRLLWTEPKKAGEARKRVHYGPLDVEDLGRVYEALLELEPGIASEPMCRLRRAKLEVVVPLAQGEKYGSSSSPVDEDEDAEDEDEEAATKKTRVLWIERIDAGRFYLRVGLGRKASGSYYTPESFVRFLVQETLTPQIEERSPKDDPNPAEILKLKVLDPAMGSGHFLVGACRFLAEHLYEAVRACDERASEAEKRGDDAETQGWRGRIVVLPDPQDELLAYLPSRAPEGSESGYSQARALAVCRRLVAVHCLYGVDKNPLAVELSKLSLWLESQAEGLPLTFMDHRLVVGDSLTGPFWENLMFLPGSGKSIEGLIQPNVGVRLGTPLREAIRFVNYLEAGVGTSVDDIEDKQRVKKEMDRALAPFRLLAAAWTGGVMVGKENCDDQAYEYLVSQVMDTGDLSESLPSGRLIREMIAHGLGVDPLELPTSRDAVYSMLGSDACIPALPYDLTFPEIFYPTGVPWGRRGFDAVVGNPPWEKVRVERRDIVAALDPRFLEGRETAGIGDEHETIIHTFNASPSARAYEASIQHTLQAGERLLPAALAEAGRIPSNWDAYQLFAIRSLTILCRDGSLGLLVGGGFLKVNKFRVTSPSAEALENSCQCPPACCFPRAA